MTNVNRRGFLGVSLTGLSAGLFAGSGTLQAKTSPGSAGHAAKVVGPDSLFLTWQDDPCTTMTIQWIGEAGTAPAQIEFARLEKEDWQAVPVRKKDVSNTDSKVFRSELTGLQPDTEYQFRIGSPEAVNRFRTMPAKATDTIQFVSGGDSGVNDHASNTNRVAASQDPRFVLMGGDLAYDNGNKPATFIKYLENYRAGMVDSAGRLIPLISCIGNHEVDSSAHHSRKGAPQYLSVFDGLFPETTYNVLDFGDYMSIVLLDTGHISPIDGEQTHWLEKTLSERQDRQHLIVANHVPAWPSYRAANGTGDKPGTGFLQREHWCPLFDRYKVDAVLEHHDHTFKRTIPLTDGLYDPNGLVYLGDGSWGRLRALNPADKRPYLAKTAEAYHLTVHRLEGNNQYHVALDEFGRVADVCHTTGKRASL